MSLVYVKGLGLLRNVEPADIGNRERSTLLHETIVIFGLARS